MTEYFVCFFLLYRATIHKPSVHCEICDVQVKAHELERHQRMHIDSDETSTFK